LPKSHFNKILSAHQPSEQFQFAQKGRIFQRGIKPGGGFHNGLPMREHIKTGTTMILAQPAVATAAERKTMIGKMPARVIYTSSAKGNRLQPGLFLAPV
jgi:hypothetical protein